MAGVSRRPDRVGGRPTLPAWHLGERDRKRIRAGGDAPFDAARAAAPRGTIRSLAYFLPVIEEVLELRVSPDYFQYLRYKLQRAVPTR